jgi:hypothetical protein
LLAYWVTFFIVRGIIYGSLRHYGASPAIFFRGIHVHHFFTGFMILLFALAYYFFKKEAGRSWFLIFGVSLGLVFDEFTFWSRLNFNYWAVGNFSAVFIAGIVLLFLYLFSKKSKKEES